MAHITSNTDKTYPCISCGSHKANIVREAASLEATKVKCNDCGMVYTASDSKVLESKGEIPNGPPVVQDAIQPGSKKRGDVAETARDQLSVARRGYEQSDRTAIQEILPRTPSFVFISKDRTVHEFYTKRDLKRAVLSWEHKGMKYDVFELNPKKISAKVDIQ